MAELTCTHDGIEIVYLELEDKWRFELRGRERKADSLKAAKEAIEKPEPKAKNAFKPIPAWQQSVGYRENETPWTAVTVTSVADSGGRWGSDKEVWITTAEGKRSKVFARRVFAATDANDAIRAEYDRLQAEVDALEEKKGSVFASLQKVDLGAFGE